MLMTRWEARETLARCHVDFRSDFHTLPSEAVGALVDAAKASRYRKQKNANGSTARMFYQYLQRRAASFETV
jgi:hypothetical protein